MANHPAMMTHASIPAEKRAELGITDDLVRLSAGIEDIEDITGCGAGTEGYIGYPKENYN